ncbi:MAG: hypothetical protein ABJC89_04460 [Acidobacteriota bacterium]
MKAVLLLAVVLIGAATVVGYGRGTVIDTVVSRSASTEPGALLLSGGALLGLAGAVRRYSL